LRYYEEKGLIAPVARAGLRRQYDRAVLDQLSLISLAQMAGFTLAEIAAMLGTKGEMQIERHALEQRAHDISNQIEELKRLQQIILHVAKCPEENHFNCKKFQQLLHLAPRIKRKAKQKP
jgi:DNA-binding transcriptional MerR regulator